jgi:hypothetical protein
MLSRVLRYCRLRLIRSDPFDLLSVLLFAALLVAAVLVFRDYAISNDEEVQHKYGEMILAYYASGFSDTRLFEFRNLYLYGGLFDVIAILIGNVIPADIYQIRHVLCALIGIGGIAAAWAAARLIAGPRAGMFAAVALAICGPWFGSMFNHTKDIPFAAAVMGSIYVLVRIARTLPQPRRRDIIAYGLLLGGALGLRAAGLMTLIFVLAAIAIAMPSAGTSRTRFALQSFLAFLPAFAIAYLIMIFAWPWAALDLFNPVRGLIAFNHFHYEIRTMLSGESYDMADVPRWYVPVYLGIKLPLTVLSGALLGLLSAAIVIGARDGTARRRQRETWFIGFAAAFPVLCQVVLHGPAFTGLRHFLFVVPPLAVLAGIGYDSLLNLLAVRRREFAAAAFGVLGVWIAWNAATLVRLHPYEYMFYNPIVGGLEGALRRYEGDYWVNIMHEAVGDLQTYVARLGKDPGKAYTVAVCGERLPFEKEAHWPLKYTDDWDTADFFLAPTQMNCDRAMFGKTVVAIERAGTVIGVVKDMRGISVDARWPPVSIARKPGWLGAADKKKL